MDFNATIDLIIKDLEEAREIIDDLKQYSGVPHLQVELAKLKCRSAGEIIAMLKTMKISQPDAVPEPVIPKQVLIQQPQEEKKPVAQEEKKPEAKTESAIERLIPLVEKKKREAIQDEIPVVQAPPRPESKKSQKKEPETPTLADKFSPSSDSFNEKFSNLNDVEEISRIIKTLPISSLSEAIGVNDKFLFIREIFNGDHNAYTKAVTQLELAGSINDAKAVIMSYTGDNAEDEAVTQLLELVKRKLLSNE